MKYGLIVFSIVLLLSLSVTAGLIDMQAVKEIESGGVVDAINPSDPAYGLYQITPICLKDYNMYHERGFEVDDLFKPKINRKVAYWYLYKRIPEMLAAYNLHVSERNILWAYNAGISNVGGEMSRHVQEYLQRYYSAKEEL